MSKPPFYRSPGFYFLLFAVVLTALLFSEMRPFRGERETLRPRGPAHLTGPRRETPTAFRLAAENPPLAQSIQLGAEIFNNTPRLAGSYVGNGMACSFCHLQGGTLEGMLGLVGVATRYPEFDPRSGRVITLMERIQSCFRRSLAGRAPAPGNPLLRNLADYVAYLSDGIPAGTHFPWRDLDWIPTEERIPIDRLQPALGGQLYAEKCAACHGRQGNGDGWAPAAWGEGSFSDGSGLARVYTLAGFLFRAMPLSSPQSLTLEQAQQVAAYLDAQPRPVFADKAADYPDGEVPVDAVYYPQRYPQNPLRLNLEAETKPRP